MHNIYISVNNYCLSSQQLGHRGMDVFVCQAQRDFSKLSNDIISVQTDKYKSWTYDMDVSSGDRGKPRVFLYELIQKHHVTK